MTGQNIVKVHFLIPEFPSCDLPAPHQSLKSHAILLINSLNSTRPFFSCIVSWLESGIVGYAVNAECMLSPICSTGG